MPSDFVKFLADTPDGKFKTGETVAVTDAGHRKALIDLKLAEAAEDPTAAAGRATDPTLKEFVGQEIAKGMTAISEQFAKHLDIRVGVKGGRDNWEEDPKWGFKSLTEQTQAIKGWYNGTNRDDRLKRLEGAMQKAPTTYGNEGLGADGGFVLAPDFRAELLRWSFNEEALLTKTRSFTTASNNLTIPKDETTPWQAAGVQTYWTAEAGQYTQVKPLLGQDQLILQKVTCLVPVTDEMLSDSFLGLGQYITQLAGPRIRFKVDEAIVNGSGAGQPEGFANSGAVVSQAKDSGQAAATFTLSNALNMISHVPAEYLMGCVWLFHPTVFPQIGLMTNGSQSLWVGPGQIEQKGPGIGRFLGLPAMPSQHCQVLGTVGDVYLVNLSQYISLTKGTGIESAMSIHLFFDYSVSTFRFNFRVAGQPWLKAPYVSQNGSFYMSPFVELATRS